MDDKNCFKNKSTEHGGMIIKALMILIMISFFAWAISCSIKNNAEDARKPTERGFTEAKALAACQNSVKEFSTFPSSVSFSLLSSANPKTNEDGSIDVKLNFEAKNGFGSLAPQAATCKFSAAGSVLDFTIRNR